MGFSLFSPIHVWLPIQYLHLNLLDFGDEKLVSVLLFLAFLSAKDPIEALSELENPGLEMLGSLPDRHRLESPRTANKGGDNLRLSKLEEPVSGGPETPNNSSVD